VDPALAFADGQLDLRDVPLRDAARDVARWFGLELRFADPSLGDYPITGTFTASSASSLAEILEHTLPVRVGQHGPVLILHRRAASAAGRAQ
jgi:ferric-dicitrate binding protein FerR (iron transport regulator)